MTQYVGINGIKGSGKDFAAKLIKSFLEENGITVEIRSFADPIKEAVETIFGPMTEEQYDEFKRVQHPVNVGGEPRLIFGRDIVRGMGMKMRSYDGGQQFIDYMNSPSDADVIICSDLRFENEFTDVYWLRKYKIVAPDVQSDGHESEQEWPSTMFTEVFTNEKRGEKQLMCEMGLPLAYLLNAIRQIMANEALSDVE